MNMYTSGFGFSFSCNIRIFLPYSSFLQRTVLITFLLLLFVFSDSFRWLGLFTFAVNSVTQTLTNSQFLCVPVCLVGFLMFAHVKWYIVCCTVDLRPLSTLFLH